MLWLEKTRDMYRTCVDSRACQFPFPFAEPPATLVYVGKFVNVPAFPDKCWLFTAQGSNERSQPSRKSLFNNSLSFVDIFETPQLLPILLDQEPIMGS